MAIVNVTPDSFSDGGRYFEVGPAVDHCLACLDAGADILDIGGESTRPGAARVAAREQIRRTVPVIGQVLADRPDAVFSIDTTLAEVAGAAVDAGAAIVNDVSAGLEDAALLGLVAQQSCGVILMHRLVPPDEDCYSTQYQQEPDYGGHVVTAVGSFLQDRVACAVAAGIDERCIVVDPGLGFGKSVEQNLELSRRMGEIARLSGDRPVLSAASRKSLVGKVSRAGDPEHRLAGTLAVSGQHYTVQGVRLFRVHDVSAHRQLFATLESIGPGAG
ncbi:MAG: dihydropteroate synthase [Planctomycetes bacterium]|nr:dihydropteroate synthase [Planctomycetota bacterium]NOG53438.1 dihydropteroate synthase [Planctomycetota bacterium]